LFRESIKRGEGIVKYPVGGEGHLLVCHFLWFINDVADSGFLWGVALDCNVPNFVAVEALVWQPVLSQVWFDLCHVPLGHSVAPVQGVGLVARVHRDWLVIHPLQGIG